MPLDANVTIDSTTWAALAFVLTVCGAAYTWGAYRRRGLTAGLRGLAWTLIPIAAWLTGTLKLFVSILNAVINWATRLVFSPTVWLGIIVAGVAAALWVISGVLRARGIGVRGRARDVGPKQVASGGRTQPARASGDDDMDEIEAILKKHGI
jgi:hypothetical protein